MAPPNLDADIDMDDPKVRRQIEQKARLRTRSQQQQQQQQQQQPGKRTSGGAGGSGGSAATATREWPGGCPGQHALQKWVVLDLGKRPSKEAYDPWSQGDDFSLSIMKTGIECSTSLTLGELREAAGGTWLEMPETDWHCVTVGLCTLKSVYP
jgi:hypothetical protein